jgi:hypothetical protein
LRQQDDAIGRYVVPVLRKVVDCIVNQFQQLAELSQKLITTCSRIPLNGIANK